MSHGRHQVKFPGGTESLGFKASEYELLEFLAIDMSAKSKSEVENLYPIFNRPPPGLEPAPVLSLCPRGKKKAIIVEDQKRAGSSINPFSAHAPPVHGYKH